jgi:protocatechuate 3,4-dioxygenase, beta subunit
MTSKISNLRRKISLFIVALPVMIVSLKTQSQNRLRPATPQDGEGPFYPKQWTGELDYDLLYFNGKKYANGTPLTLAGQVISTDGSPIEGASVELWQCDETGEYRHPSSGGEAPAQRGFQGFGRVISGSEGNYRFRTLKPVPYNGRPAHVHFKVTAPGYRSLTTQMYFANESKEGTLLLRIYQFFGGFSNQRDLLTVATENIRVDERDELTAQFELILERVG